MKSLIFTLLFAVTSFVAAAQCTPPATLPGAGLHPDGDTACFVIDTAASYTVFFQNFGDNVSAAGVTVNVDSIIIDSVGGLPCGVSWTTNKAAQGHKFVKNEIGCFQLSGTTTDGEGVYEAVLYVIAYINNQQQPQQRLPSTLLDNTRLVVKVRNAATTNCSSVNTVVQNTCETGPSTSINEVAANLGGFGNHPNPFNSFTNIEFTAKNNAVYTLKVVNMLGAVVYTEQVVAQPGRNTVRMERGNLPAGVYVYSIGNGAHSINSRMVVGQ